MTNIEALELAIDEIERIKSICLRECGVGIANEVVIRQLKSCKQSLEQKEPSQQQPISEDVKSCLLFSLFHHQGSHSKIGQPIRYALGIGKFDELNDEQLSIAMRVQSLLISKEYVPLTDDELKEIMLTVDTVHDIYEFNAVSKTIEQAVLSKLSAPNQSAKIAELEKELIFAKKYIEALELNIELRIKK